MYELLGKIDLGLYIKKKLEMYITCIARDIQKSMWPYIPVKALVD